MMKKCFDRVLAVALSVILLIGSLAPSAMAEDDFLMQLFVLALLEEYGVYSTDELLDLLGADSVEELYGSYGAWDGYDEGGYWGGDDDVAYYDDEGYPIYLDELSGCYYGLYNDDTAYIAGSVNAGGRKQAALYIPSIVGGYPVYDVYDYAFADVAGIGSVTIAEGVERISEGAFAGCGLKSLTLPSSVRDIEYSAFAECESLAEISFSSGLEYIGVNAFAGCSSLRTVILPDSVTEIDYDAFFNCANLASVQIGSGLTMMAGNVFSMSDKLTDLTVSAQNRVFRIRDGILYNTVKNSIVRYPGNRDEQEFTVPDGIACVEDGCFADTNSLLRITLPDSVKTIEDYAFYGCRQCQYFDLGNGVMSIGDAAIPTNQLRGVYLPDSVIALQELSLFSMTDEPYAYDDFWVLANSGSYAEQWAYGMGYDVYSPTESSLATIGAIGQKHAVLKASPSIVDQGDMISLQLTTADYTGMVKFNIEGTELAEAEIYNGSVLFIYKPEQVGVFTVSALVGNETVAWCQVAVADGTQSAFQPLLTECSHDAAQISKPAYTEVRYTDTGTKEQHQETRCSYNTWVCSACKAYFIDAKPVSETSESKAHNWDAEDTCEHCGYVWVKTPEEIMCDTWGHEWGITYAEGMQQLLCDRCRKYVAQNSEEAVWWEYYKKISSVSADNAEQYSRLSGYPQEANAAWRLVALQASDMLTDHGYYVYTVHRTKIMTGIFTYAKEIISEPSFSEKQENMWKIVLREMLNRDELAISGEVIETADDAESQVLSWLQIAGDLVGGFGLDDMIDWQNCNNTLYALEKKFDSGVVTLDDRLKWYEETEKLKELKGEIPQNSVGTIISVAAMLANSLKDGFDSGEEIMRLQENYEKLAVHYLEHMQTLTAIIYDAQEMNNPELEAAAKEILREIANDYLAKQSEYANIAIQWLDGAADALVALGSGVVEGTATLVTGAYDFAFGSIVPNYGFVSIPLTAYQCISNNDEIFVAAEDLMTLAVMSGKLDISDALDNDQADTSIYRLWATLQSMGCAKASDYVDLHVGHNTLEDVLSVDLSLLGLDETEKVTVQRTLTTEQKMFDAYVELRE